MNKNIWLEAQKYLLVIATIIVISLLFPSSTRFKHEFHPNHIWGQEDIQAPYDFPLLKSDKAINQERQRIIRDFSPYYTLDQKKVGEVKKRFIGLFDVQLNSATDSNLYQDVQQHTQLYKETGLGLIDQVYKHGIVYLDTAHTNVPTTMVVNILEGNTLRKKTIQSLSTVATAKQSLLHGMADIQLKDRAFLIKTVGESLAPNLMYDKQSSQKYLDAKLEDVSRSRGIVRAGERIIKRGDKITPDRYQKLLSYKKEYERRSGTEDNIWVFLGYLLLTTLVIGMLLLFLMYNARTVYSSFKRMLSIFIWPIIFSFLIYIVERYTALNPYIIPFCIVPIIISHFFGDRLAFFLHVTIILIASFLSSLGYEFTFVQIVAGMIAIFTGAKTWDLSMLLRTSILIFLAYVVGFIGLNLIEKGSLNSVDWNTMGWAFFNGFLTLLAYPLIPLLEKLFGFTTQITLSELGNTNHPLLKRLAKEAPGTFQHSLQVANLSEQVANALDLDAILTKTAALYHDIGKLKNPEYFIENQQGENPHDSKTDLESARIIMSHVPDGVQMAKKAGLPRAVIDFIQTHHGTTRAEYFYRNYVNNHPDEVVDEKLFTYAGPKPQTKEQTILMMADSLEAASKSIKEPNEEKIAVLVDNIIQSKVTAGQLEESPLTFQELEMSKKIFKTAIGRMLHIRIEYPELKAKNE